MQADIWAAAANALAADLCLKKQHAQPSLANYTLNAMVSLAQFLLVLLKHKHTWHMYTKCAKISSLMRTCQGIPIHHLNPVEMTTLRC